MPVTVEDEVDVLRYIIDFGYNAQNVKTKTGKPISAIIKSRKDLPTIRITPRAPLFVRLYPINTTYFPTNTSYDYETGEGFVSIDIEAKDRGIVKLAAREVKRSLMVARLLGRFDDSAGENLSATIHGEYDCIYFVNQNDLSQTEFGIQHIVQEYRLKSISRAIPL